MTGIIAIAFYLLVIQFMLTKSLNDLGVVREWQPRWMQNDTEANHADRSENTGTNSVEHIKPEEGALLTSDPIVDLMIPEVARPTIGL